MIRAYAHRHARRIPVLCWPVMVDPSLRRRIETRLLALREEIRGAGNLEVGAALDPTRKPDDDAAPHEEMSQVIASNRNRARTEELREIEAALERLADDPDGFGVCEACEEEIPARRLELRPWVRLCIDCQEADEREHAPGARKHITDYR
jgi:RNA polymerase-binding transcription factor